MSDNRYALIIASSEYSDVQLSKLRSPAADAELLGEVLRDPRIGAYELQTLLNPPGAVAMEAIEAFFKDRASLDQLLLYFSCHGIVDDYGALHFAVPTTKSDRLDSTAISGQFVSQQMYRCSARRIILILDCCYSGAFTRGFLRRAGDRVRLDDLSGRGRAVLSATSATEFSFEPDGSQVAGTGIPSLFTGAIAQGLLTGEADLDGDGEISVEELYVHAARQVRNITPKQNPGRYIESEGPIFVAHSVMAASGLAALPGEVRSALSSPWVGMRKGAIEELETVLREGSERERAAATAALRQLTADASVRVAAAAMTALGLDPPAPDAGARSPVAASRDVAAHGPGAHMSADARDGAPQVSQPVEGAGAAEMAQWVEKKLFATTMLRPGYDQQEVDVFLDKVRDTFLGVPPLLTPFEVRNIQFSTMRFVPGYDEEEVDNFLDQVELKLAAMPHAPASKPRPSRETSP